MALAQVGGGYQVGDGNVNEVQLTNVNPQAATVTTTLTAAQIIGNILVANPGASAASYTLPTVALLEATVANAKTQSALQLRVVNLGTASGVVTVLAGTGWTIVGTATIAVTSSAQFVAVKTGVGTWTLYRTT